MSWLKRPVKGLLLDISGVLRDGDHVIPGSLEAVQRLQASGIPFRLVTNETQVTVEKTVEKLTKLGFTGICPSSIFAPAPAVAAHLRENSLRGYLLVHPNVLPQFEGVETTEPNCVVVGDAAEHFNYERLNQAFRVLLSLRDKEEPMRLFSLGKGRYYKEEDGLCLDLGPFTAALEYATGAQAQIFGKPNATFFQAALKDLSLSPEEVVMIGDDIVGDVGGAQGAGLRGVLVRTGKFRASDENHDTVKPDAIVDNLSQAVELIMNQNL
ncbi:Phospholysine phosphohistidine inorganic pyrophosphate phosphatase [Orchesella cincta]|uniref:Phospholysine phosphohistidine inorganic pyrophosphate phosphatase n=1 Tax=Orchesella cincta TaxID=48709 RepID=A0A1D2MYA2_ORCCI|nr:Phospholysine phosphohistidine inorganic pyrophosphate phosphatase [Orchesella cincta]